MGAFRMPSSHCMTSEVISVNSYGRMPPQPTKVIYSAYYRKGELLNELTHRYDMVGRLQELVSYDILGEITGRVTNDYDESGKRTRSTTQIFGETRPRTWVTTYEYDSLGNWIKEQTSEQSLSSQPATTPANPIVEERTIQYYAPTDRDTAEHP